MLMADSIISRSPEETCAAGRILAARLPRGAIVGVSGALGSGKTHFAKGLCAGLGFDGEVTSPTFTLVHEYPVAGGATIAHVDFYRLDTETAAIALGLDEIFATSACTIIEWADRFSSLLPPHSIAVQIDSTGESTRRITIENLNTSRACRSSG